MFIETLGDKLVFGIERFGLKVFRRKYITLYNRYKNENTCDDTRDKNKIETRMNELVNAAKELKRIASDYKEFVSN